MELERDKTDLEHKQTIHNIKEKMKQKLHEAQMAKDTEINQLKKEKRNQELEF